MHGTVAMYTSMGALLSVVTQLVMVEESLHGLVAMCTSVGTSFPLVTQPIMVEE